MMEAGDETDVGVLVLAEHQNYFTNLCEILSEHTGRVLLFSTAQYRSNVTERIERKPFDWKLKSDDESICSYLNRVEAICEADVDILIVFPFPGMRSILASLGFNPECQTIQMVYNVNLWTMRNPVFTPRLYKYLELPLRSILLSRMDALLVEYTPIQRSLQLRTDINVHSFTPIVHEGASPTSDGTWEITVPGFIDPKRRNYRNVLDALENALRAHQSNLRVRLLGRPTGSDGQRIARRCDELADEGWKISYHTDWIPIHEFEAQLRESDVILAPMRRTKVVLPVRERYGVTKASGCFGDAIRYGNPLVLPAHYRVPEEVAPAVRQYESVRELGTVLLKTLEQEGLSQKELTVLTRRYSLEAQRNRLYGIFEDILGG